MAGYIIADVDIHDLEKYRDYRRMTGPTLAAFGGRPLVAGGPLETLEGKWAPKRLVVLEFPSVGQAKEWWASEDYREAKELRQRIGFTNMVVVDGLPDRR